MKKKGITTMRKTIIFISTALLGLFLLTACGTSAQADPSQVDVEAGASAGVIPAGDAALLDTDLAITPVPGTGDEPQAMQLALGTFRLEATDYPVGAEQAAALLPLWKAARSLSQSETVATEELQAVIDQIGDTMTAEQLAALASMSTDSADMNVLAEQYGFEFGFGSGQVGDLSLEMQATMQAARESGQPPPGGFGGGGGPGFGGGPGGGSGLGEGLSPEQRQTAVAERGGLRRAGLGVPSSLLDAVIEFLEAKL
jgi:hypothetical protein